MPVTEAVILQPLEAHTPKQTAKHGREKKRKIERRVSQQQY